MKQSSSRQGTGVAIAGAARTAIGSYGKSLAGVPAAELGARSAGAALERAGLSPEQVDLVVFGNVIHTATEDMYMARVVGIKAGVPKEVPALTVNRLCGTGVQAIISAAQSIQGGDGSVALAGGAESMSRAPYWAPAARWGARIGEMPMVDPVLGGLSDPFHDILMGVTAENLADRDGIGREDQDRFAVESHRRFAAAQEAGRFLEQIVPIPTEGGGADFARDEHVRPGATVEALAELPAVFRKNGTVTAGNSSGMNDAAAALVLVDEDRADALGIPVQARILAGASCGVDPKLMGIGPVPAVRKVLARTGVSLSDIGVIELNEAFAAQALAVIRELDLDPAVVNPNGGAIAHGHPIAATGAAITTKALAEMERADLELGLVTLCIGGGQGIAMLLERVR